MACVAGIHAYSKTRCRLAAVFVVVALALASIAAGQSDATTVAPTGDDDAVRAEIADLVDGFGGAYFDDGHNTWRVWQAVLVLADGAAGTAMPTSSGAILILPSVAAASRARP